MFYVYRLDRPWNGVPCYIGKGQGKRHAYHAQRGTRHSNKHLASIYRKAGDTPVPVVIVAEGLTEDEAFALEIKLIAEIGRADQGRGPLANWSDGGEGGNTGAIRSAETRAKLSASLKAIGHRPNIDAVEASRIGKLSKGRKASDEARAKMSRSHTGLQDSAETRRRKSEAMTLSWARRKG
jgi:hypothetical protein